MKPFHQLTEHGQVRRLRKLAHNALHEYALETECLRLIAVHTNTIFRVDANGGEKYALRICTPGEHSLADNLAEVTWLAALRRDTSLHVATPVANREGDYITLANANGVPEERRSILFEWIAGAPLDAQLTPENYGKLGAASATLHEHAAGFRAPADFQPMRWDKVFYYPHEPVLIYDDQYSALFPPARRKMIEAVQERAQALLNRISANGDALRVIHGDLHVWNVHVHDDQLYLLDFEDLMIGSPLQDIAITLSYKRDHKEYPALATAFAEGYKTVRPWPVESAYELETLMAARTLMFINYAAHSQPNPLEHIESMSKKLATFLAKWE